MSDQPLPPEIIALGQFEINRAKLDPAELIPYAGKHIAWSLDGTRILAHADSDEALYEQLDALGIPGGQFVHEYVDGPDDLPHGLEGFHG